MLHATSTLGQPLNQRRLPRSGADSYATTGATTCANSAPGRRWVMNDRLLRIARC